MNLTFRRRRDRGRTQEKKESEEEERSAPQPRRIGRSRPRLDAVSSAFSYPASACPNLGFTGPVGDDDHPRMNRVSDSHSPAMVHGNPRRARRRVQECVQNWPVGDGIRPVAHRFRLPVRGGDRSRVEMIAANDDRGSQSAGSNELVEEDARPIALPIAEPANPRREPLEGDPLLRQRDPASQCLVFGEELEERGVRLEDVLRIAGESGPPERA